MRSSRLFAIPLLAGLVLSAGARAEDVAISVKRTDDGHGIVSFSLSVPRPGSDPDIVQASFDLGETKGIGRDDRPFVANTDKSLIAVTNYPATKTSYVHLFIRKPNGDLIAVSSVHTQVAKLLPRRWAEAAQSRLEATAISGRVVQMSAFDYVRGNEAEEHRFKVSVGNDGTLTLAR